MRHWRVHIGQPKAGSTTIQRMLSSTRKSLLGQGWLYPLAASRAGGHHDIAFLLGGGYPDWALPQDRTLSELAADLAQEVRQHDGAVVLSSEDFYLFPAPVALRELIDEVSGEPADVHIDLYLRALPALGLSWYNQAVKAMGYAGSVEDNLREMASTWDIEAQVAPWVEAFGPTSVHLRAFPPPAAQLARDYLEVLGAGELWTPELETVENPGLVRDVLEVQRLINQLPLDKLDKRRFRRLMSDGHAWRERGLSVEDGPIVEEAFLREWASPLVEGAVRVVGELGWNGPTDPSEVAHWFSGVPRRKVWRAGDGGHSPRTGALPEQVVRVLYALLLEVELSLSPPSPAAAPAAEGSTPSD